MTLTYQRPSWMSWEDQGGSLFGGKDVTEALKRGISYKDIQAAVRASDKIARDAGEVAGSGQYGGRFGLSGRIDKAVSDARSGNVGTGLGASDQYTGGADIALFNQVAGGSEGERAQTIRRTANWNPESLNLSTGIGTTRSNITATAMGQDAIDIANQSAADTRAWEKAESDRRAAEHEQLMKLRREEALKVKYQGSTAVGRGQSAMGIKFKESPILASGQSSRGTGQLARSDKGTKLTTLNIA